MDASAPHPEPVTLADRAADAALTAMRRLVEEEGAELECGFVSVSVKDAPEGEEYDSSAAGTGFESNADFFLAVATHLVAVGRGLGINVMLAPMGGRG